MFGLLFDSPASRAREERWRAETIARRTPLCVPWTNDIKWAKELNIQASTFPTYNLFPHVRPYPANDVNNIIREGGSVAFSPDKRWVYCVKTLEPGAMLMTMSGSKQGSVLFDGEVNVPALHERDSRGYERAPWMSITPMEIMTLRGGTRLAKGHTVVAGLGLGYQLIEVSKRKKVERITLVEKSQELVDWLWPQIKPMVDKPVDVIIESAHTALPKLTADVGLIDIFFHYGNNDDDHADFVRTCKGIKKLWSWGTAKVGDASSRW
jgi:hypothetical protein